MKERERIQKEIELWETLIAAQIACRIAGINFGKFGHAIEYKIIGDHIGWKPFKIDLTTFNPN